jgi:formiminotetrahydrofolate cyclodeaminase
MSERTPLVALSDQRVGDFLAALGARTPAPASGAATALTAAMAASLVELVARFADDEAVAARSEALAARLIQLADEDVDAYTAFMANRTDETRQRIIAVPEEIAAHADEIAKLAVGVRERVSRSVAGDADAANELATAAACVARRLVELNVGPSKQVRPEV